MRDDVYHDILVYLAGHMTQERIRHSQGVAELAAALCRRHGVDRQKGRVAGIGHDIAREWNGEDTLSYITRHGLRADHWERVHPVVLHGLVGKEILARQFGIRDREILRAVRHHVLGRPGLGLLGRILFVADFLEPGRGFMPEEQRLHILGLPLNEALLRVVGGIFTYLRVEKKPIAPVTKKMYDRLRITSSG